VLTLIVVAIGTVLAIFAGYEVALMAASLPWLLRRKSSEPLREPAIRFLIVIPAHNEGALTGETVRSVLASRYPDSLREVVVIADNCDDDTADHARRAGATCFERHDHELRGKPQALHWFFKQYDLSGFTGVVIVDADTVVHPDFLRIMGDRLQRGEQATQGYYGVVNPDETWLTRLAVLPAVLKFYLNFPGKQLFGLSCPLAGNGMCFNADILRRLGWNAFTLSEDWEYYLILAIHGYRVTSAPEAIIYGQVASSLRLGQAQRVRWMKGRVHALQLHWRPLLDRGLRERELAPLDAIFDVARPTHAILLTASIAYLGVCLLLWYREAIGGGPALFAAVVLGSQVFYFLAGLAVARPPLRTWLALGAVPFYLIWKLVITLKAVFRMREKTWVKTTRN